MRTKLSNEDDIKTGPHVVAYGTVAMTIEHHMRRVNADEMAQIVCEDNNEIRKRIKRLHRYLSDPGSQFKASHSDLLPIGRIIDTVHFAAKQESAPLQLADFCAWVGARRTREAKHSEELAGIIAPFLVRKEQS
jgi:hypothetical protein